MSTEYIVKFSKLIDGIFEPSIKQDGYVELSPSNTNSRIPTISVRTHKDSNDTDNISLLFKFITSNFANVDFDDNNKVCYLSYKDGYSRSIDYKSIIEFDSSSSSAYSEFKNHFENLLTTEQETLYYQSGRVKYIGSIKKLDNLEFYNGEGTLYFDSYFNKVQYTGEFEDGDFDGSGKFFNMDNNMTLIANNISNGIPVQNGKLIVNFRNRKEIIDIDFDKLWFDLELSDKNEKRSLVKQVDFVNIIASSYLNTSEKSMNQLIFEDRSTTEQHLIIWNDIQKIKEELNTIKSDSNINMNNIVNVTKALTSILIFNLLINLVALYFS